MPAIETPKQKAERERIALERFLDRKRLQDASVEAKDIRPRKFIRPSHAL